MKKLKCPFCQNNNYKDFKVYGNYNMVGGDYSAAEQICCKKCDGLFTIKYNGFLRGKDKNTDFKTYKGWDSIVGLGAIGTSDQWGATGGKGFNWDKSRNKLRDVIENFKTMSELKNWLNNKCINQS